MSKYTIYGLITLLLVVIAGEVGYYFLFINIPEKNNSLEQAVQPLPTLSATQVNNTDTDRHNVYLKNKNGIESATTILSYSGKIKEIKSDIVSGLFFSLKQADPNTQPINFRLTKQELTKTTIQSTAANATPLQATDLQMEDTIRVMITSDLLNSNNPLISIKIEKL